MATSRLVFDQISGYSDIAKWTHPINHHIDEHTVKAGTSIATFTKVMTQKYICHSLFICGREGSMKLSTKFNKEEIR